MKGAIAIARLVVAGMLLVLGVASGEVSAQSTPAYLYQTTSVTSNSTPVQILTSGTARTTYGCKTLTGAAVALDVWAYSGSLPVSKPTNYTVINPGDAIGDSLTNPTLQPVGSDVALAQPWAAVLDSGSSAVTVFCWWR